MAKIASVSVRILTSAVLSVSSLHASAEPQSSPAAALAPRIETIELSSKIFKNQRLLRVLLPADYENSTKRYPVLYLNDGSNYFEPTGIDVVGVVTDLISRGALQPIIVVGIDSAATIKDVKDPELARADEYIPYSDTGFPPDHLVLPAEVPNPHGQMYPSFLADEVMPLINKSFRTLTGPSNTGLGGYSYGAVAALYTAMTRPDLIGHLMLESTPLWVGPDYQLLNEAVKVTHWPEFTYLGLGTKEGDDDAGANAEGEKNQNRLADAIRTHAPATHLTVILEAGARHRPPAWHRRLPAALKAIW